jgi:hypothetical protein
MNHLFSLALYVAWHSVHIYVYYCYIFFWIEYFQYTMKFIFWFYSFWLKFCFTLFLAQFSFLFMWILYFTFYLLSDFFVCLEVRWVFYMQNSVYSLWLYLSQFLSLSPSLSISVCVWMCTHLCLCLSLFS